jgi:hypothetical protein
MGVEKDGTLEGAVEHSADLFDAPTVDRLVAHWGTLLRAALAEVDQQAEPLRAAVLLDRIAHEQFHLARPREAAETRRRALELLPPEPSKARAEVLSSMAKQAIWTGQPDEGLTLAGQGLIRPDRLTATGRALLHTDQARALAKMRRINETLTAIGTADEHFAHATPDNDTPCLAFYNDARHAQFTGRTLFDLAVLGHNLAQEVTDRLTAAAAGHIADNNTRSRVICLTKLASLAMVTGDPIQAATMGHAAVDAAGTIRSRQVTEELRELARYAAPHQHLDEVAHLLHRIGTLLRRTDSL